MPKGWTHAEELDWESISTEPLPGLEPGIYRCKVLEAEPTETKGNKPSIVITLEATEALDGNSLEGRSVKIRYERLMLSREGAFHTKQFACSAKLAPPRSSAYEIVEQWSHDIVGVDVIARLKVGEPSKKDGRRYTVVDRYLTDEQAQEVLGGSAPEEADAPAKPKRIRRAG